MIVCFSLILRQIGLIWINRMSHFHQCYCEIFVVIVIIKESTEEGENGTQIQQSLNNALLLHALGSKYID